MIHRRNQNLPHRFARVTRLTSALWNLACKHESIDPAGKFVVFDDANNPHARRYNRVVAILLAIRQQASQARRLAS